MNRILIFLNNYDKKYKNTFHNIALEFFKFSLKESSKHNIILQKEIEGENYIIFKNNKNRNKILIPKNYMNENILSLQSYLESSPQKRDYFIFFDDVNVDLGKFKLNPSVGNRSHNGLRPFIDVVGQFFRVRMGIKPNNNNNISLQDYVLKELDVIEQNEMLSLYKKLFYVFLDILENKKENKIMERNQSEKNQTTQHKSLTKRLFDEKKLNE